MNKKLLISLLFIIYSVFYPLYSDDFILLQNRGIQLIGKADILFLTLIVGLSIITLFITIIILILLRIMLMMIG